VNRPDSPDGRSKRRSSVLPTPRTAAFPVCRFGAYRLIERLDHENDRGAHDGPAEMYRDFF
jgi:hypothetical protein